MQTASPTFYMYEPDNWNDAIDLHISEIDKTTCWLKEIFELNAKLEIKVTIEDLLARLRLHRIRKDLLITNIAVFETYLYENKIVEGKENITSKTKIRQDEMRLQVYNAEKEYLDLMYTCNSFLTGYSK